MSKKNTQKKALVIALSATATVETAEGKKAADSLFANVDGLITNAIGEIKKAVIPFIKATLETPEAEGVAYPLVTLINGTYAKGFGQWLSAIGFKIEKDNDRYTIIGFKYPEGCENAEDVAAVAEGEDIDLNIIHTPKPKDESNKANNLKKWRCLESGVIEDIRKNLVKSFEAQQKKHSTANTVYAFVTEKLLNEDFVRDVLADYLAKNK